MYDMDGADLCFPASFAVPYKTKGDNHIRLVPNLGVGLDKISYAEGICLCLPYLSWSYKNPMPVLSILFQGIDLSS